MKQMVKSIFENTGSRWVTRRVENHNELVEFLNREYPNLSRNQQIYLCVNDFEKVPTCASSICDRVPFFHSFKYGYKTTCSTSCQVAFAKEEGKWDQYKKKAQKTTMERYGVSNVSQNPEIRKKIDRTNLNRYGRKEGNLNMPNVKERVLKSINSPEARKKTIETNIQRYGVPNPLMDRDKSRNTLMEKYGVDSVSSIPYLVERRKNKRIEKYKNVCTNVKIIDIIPTGSDKPHSQDHVHFECNVCGDEEVINSMTLLYRGINFSTPCTNCLGGPPTGSSFAEREIGKFLNSIDVEFIPNSRSIIPPYELDIFIPDSKIAIEYCGLYWHSEPRKTKNYHIEKHKLCENSGIRLLTIFEDEWKNSQSIVERIIKNRLNKSEKGIGARKLHVSEISKIEARKFLDHHHLQGSKICTVFIGAYHDGDLVGVMGFSPTRDNRSIELSRYATNDKVYPGLASRLFQYYVYHYDPETVVSFADMRWSDGNLYGKLGFEFEKQINPDYYYVKGDKRDHKSLYRKSSIEKKFQIDITGKTERELMDELGYYRIWDCGKMKFVWNR